MKHPTHLPKLPQLIMAGLLSTLSLVSLPALAQANASKADTCGPHTDPAACRQEARAVRAAPPQAQAGINYQANALARCQRHPADMRASCENRIRNGTTSGSVSTGGTLTELREVVPAKN